jgi:hypothetical protein
MVSFTLVLVLLVHARELAAETPLGAPRHIRTTDQRLLRLVDEGTRVSGTFRGLVHRLAGSDVIVYLECDGRVTPAGGRLTWISAAGGYRYVRVRVTRLNSPGQQIAIIGHELQHAVEIAAAPAIVDAASLAREYQRIGFVNARTAGGVAFDTEAAVRTGYQVLRELVSGSGD